MGAMAICGSYPFQVHRVTRYPISFDELYDGPYAYMVGNYQVDYVVFPIGLVADGDDHVLMSFGYQDKHAYIARINVPKLLKTMKLENVCNSN